MVERGEEIAVKSLLKLEQGQTLSWTNAREEKMSRCRERHVLIGLRAAIEVFTFGVLAKRAFLSTQNVLANPVEAPTGIEPV